MEFLGVVMKYYKTEMLVECQDWSWIINYGPFWFVIANQAVRSDSQKLDSLLKIKCLMTNCEYDVVNCADSQRLDSSLNIKCLISNCDYEGVSNNNNS